MNPEVVEANYLSNIEWAKIPLPENGGLQSVHEIHDNMTNDNGTTNQTTTGMGLGTENEIANNHVSDTLNIDLSHLSNYQL